MVFVIKIAAFSFPCMCEKRTESYCSLCSRLTVKEWDTMSSAMISWVFLQTAKFRNGAQCCPVYHPTSKITRDDRIGKCLSN